MAGMLNFALFDFLMRNRRDTGAQAFLFVAGRSSSRSNFVGSYVKYFFI